MWLKIWFVFVIVMCAIYVHAEGKEGEACSKDGVPGICKDLSKCPSAVEDINKNGKKAEICSSNKEDPVVCCVDNKISTTVPEHTILKRTTEDEPKDDCDPIPASKTASKNGQKAWDKCIEYQHLVYPCENNTSLTGPKVRVNKCHHDFAELIIGGSQAQLHEFPHAALLGYGNDSISDKLQWICAGALISDRFILSAAHCTRSRNDGRITYAALRMTNKTNIDPEHQYKVKTIINHPEYKAPYKSHDISLLELEKPVLLDSFTVPACLDTGDSERENALSTSTYDFLTYTHTDLQKLRLTKFSTAECIKIFPKTRLSEPFNETSQLCYGDRTQTLDICSDDGGSPLLVENQKVSCMYTIIGITSFGMKCFTEGPGVYTKVAHYLPWIEGVVWP